MPIELGFILQRLAHMANETAPLRERQPWKAAYTQDFSWLGAAVTKHYDGDDGDIRILIGGIIKAFEGMDVEAYQRSASAFLHQALHPTLKRPLPDCGYAPMIELLRYLEEHEFTTYIASGGDRDFMRVVTQEMYGVPAERVIGSSNSLCYTEIDGRSTVAYLGKPDVFDDGPAKPVRIWGRIGRRPILSVGNSNGDIQMFRFTGKPGGPALRVLLLHDDLQRDADYTTGAERALQLAREEHWAVVSVRKDWSRVFR
jgi:hypothetical protein